VDHVLIGELAARTGVSQRALRYYEQQGLLSAARDPNGYRRYAPDAVRTVARIRGLLAAGLSTDVIRGVLPCVGGGEPIELELCPDLVRTIRRELAEMDARIGELQQTRGNLAGYLPTPESTDQACTGPLATTSVGTAGIVRPGSRDTA
jgi:DNA-binding transcriptional MerR regulator